MQAPTAAFEGLEGSIRRFRLHAFQHDLPRQMQLSRKETIISKMLHVDIVSCKGDNCYTIQLEGTQQAPIIHGGLWRLRKGSWSLLIQEKQAQASKGTMPEKTQHCVGFQQELGYAPITACGPKLHVFPYLELLMV